MEKAKYDVHKVITWKDIDDLVKNVEEYYETYTHKIQSPLYLLKVIHSIYKKFMDEQLDKNINLNDEKNRPKVLRSEVIKMYRQKEPGQWKPDETPNDTYARHKGTINSLLEDLAYERDRKMKRILNPKGIVIAGKKRSGAGESTNYFIPLAPKHIRQKKDYFIFYLKTNSSVTVRQFLKIKFDIWKRHHFDGDRMLKPPDLFRIHSGLDPAVLDDDSLGFFYASCLYRRYYYHIWWEKLKDKIRNNPKVLRHIVILLLLSDERPFWRAAFVLQYIDKRVFHEVLSKFSGDIHKDERIEKGIETICLRKVEEFLSTHKDVEGYSEEILNEITKYKYSFEGKPPIDIKRREQQMAKLFSYKKKRRKTSKKIV